MSTAGSARRFGLAAAIVLATGPLAAQQLDPRVATPLSQLIAAAGLQCQAGDPRACGAVQQLRQAGAELAQAEFACRQGHPQACLVFQSGSQQVFAAWQQHLGGAQAAMGQPRYAAQPQDMFEHDQRMLERRMLFQQHQDRMAQQRAMMDERHRVFMEQLRR